MALVDQTISLGNSGWAIATDGIQWILQRQRGDGRWRAVSFVRTSKDTLRRCCRENGATGIESLLAPLPDYFPGWDVQAEAFADGYSLFIAGKAPRPILKAKTSGTKAGAR